MDQNEINKEIHKRLERLERAVLSAMETKKAKQRQKRKKAIDLGAPIKEQHGAGFFSEWKTDLDVIQKLREKALTPKRASVSNVLRRFVVKGLLTRKGGGTKKHPWQYKKK